MDRDKCQIGIAVKDASRCPLAQEGLEHAERLTRPTELKTEEDGQGHRDDSHEDSRNEELLRDHLVILTENVLGDEALLVVCVCSHGFLFSGVQWIIAISPPSTSTSAEGAGSFSGAGGVPSSTRKASCCSNQAS